MTRPCVRCGRSVGKSRACISCVGEIRHRFGKQIGPVGAFVAWEFDKKSTRGGRCHITTNPDGGEVALFNVDYGIPRTMRPSVFFHDRLVRTMAEDGLTARSSDEDLAPVRRIIAEWAYRMECEENRRIDGWLYELTGDRPE